MSRRDGEIEELELGLSSPVFGDEDEGFPFF
jgi:hypothetical protein